MRGLLALALCLPLVAQAQVTRFDLTGPAEPAFGGREFGAAKADAIFSLWRWAWVAALITGVIVWGLIFWSVWRYRRRPDDEVPSEPAVRRRLMAGGIARTP